MEMTTGKMMLDVNHFIMLDVTDTVSENEIASGSANVQIVYPPNKNTAFDIKTIMNRFGRTLKIGRAHV